MPCLCVDGALLRIYGHKVAKSGELDVLAEVDDFSLLAALLSDGQVPALLLRRAEAAGADPTGEFCAAAGAGPWRLGAGWSARGTVDGHQLVLVQTGSTDGLPAPVTPGSPVGFGMVRRGWDGARLTLVDTLQAFELARARGTSVRFDEEWVAATLLAAGDRLGPACEDARAVAERSSHIADAVSAFADHGLSVVGAARALQVHPNTVIYRLDRWRSLTGWDARSFAGLAKSMAALELAGQAAAS
jgi:hypothetical protein